MKKEIMLEKKLFYLIASISLIIMALSFVYYFVLFLPQKEKEKYELEWKKFELETQKIEEEKKESQEKSQLLEDCLNRVTEQYTEFWNSACQKLGREDKCDLPTSWAESFEEGHQLEKENCFKQYQVD